MLGDRHLTSWTPLRSPWPESASCGFWASMLWGKPAVFQTQRRQHRRRELLPRCQRQTRQAHETKVERAIQDWLKNEESLPPSTRRAGASKHLADLKGGRDLRRSASRGRKSPAPALSASGKAPAPGHPVAPDGQLISPKPQPPPLPLRETLELERDREGRGRSATPKPAVGLKAPPPEPTGGSEESQSAPTPRAETPKSPYKSFPVKPPPEGSIPPTGERQERILTKVSPPSLCEGVMPPRPPKAQNEAEGCGSANSSGGTSTQPMAAPPQPSTQLAPAERDDQGAPQWIISISAAQTRSLAETTDCEAVQLLQGLVIHVQNCGNPNCSGCPLACQIGSAPLSLIPSHLQQAPKTPVASQGSKTDQPAPFTEGNEQLPPPYWVSYFCSKHRRNWYEKRRSGLTQRVKPSKDENPSGVLHLFGPTQKRAPNSLGRIRIP